MHSDSGLSAELKTLLEAVLEGHCTAAQLAQLEHMLQLDRDARRAYVQYISTLAGVRRYLQCQSSVLADIEQADLEPVSAESVATGSISTQRLEPAARTNGETNRQDSELPAQSANSVTVIQSSRISRTLKSVRQPAALVLCASVLGIAAAVWFFARQPMPHGPVAESSKAAAVQQVETTDHAVTDGGSDAKSIQADRIELAEPTKEPVFIARVTDSHNAVWAGLTQKSPGPSMLAIGQACELTTGLVEIVFDNGATVLLEGPVKLVLDSRMQATLEFGQLTAHVPPQAVGFTIQTPSVNVVDLGTDFGVRVSQQGMTDVAVFSGEVIAASRDESAGKGQQVRITADEVRRFLAGLDADEEPLGAPKFTKSIPAAINVVNPGFELPRIGGWMVRELTGWTVVSEPQWNGALNAGVLLTAAERIQLPVAAEGHQWGFIESRRAADGGVHRTSIHQAVGRLTPDTQYRLQIALGREGFKSGPVSKKNYPFSTFEGVEVGLWTGPNTAAGPTEPLKTIRVPTPSLAANGVEVVTVEYGSPLKLLVGHETLFIRISINADDWCRILLDDVRLDAVSNSAISRETTPSENTDLTR